jgi:hypothetical protein
MTEDKLRGYIIPIGQKLTLCAMLYALFTRNPQPVTRNPKPATRNPKPATRNPKPATRNPRFLSQAMQ